MPLFYKIMETFEGPFCFSPFKNQDLNKRPFGKTEKNSATRKQAHLELGTD